MEHLLCVDTVPGAKDTRGAKYSLLQAQELEGLSSPRGPFGGEFQSSELIYLVPWASVLGLTRKQNKEM